LFLGVRLGLRDRERLRLARSALAVLSHRLARLHPWSLPALRVLSGLLALPDLLRRRRHHR
jgi:hypothetical protein